MKSIKYLLITLILLNIYNSDFPNTFAELTKTDWVYLVFFTLFFWYGNHLDTNK